MAVMPLALDSVEFVGHLDTLGVPIWTELNRSDTLTRPRGWQDLTPDQNTDRITHRPAGAALCANMGGPIAVVDVDTKNGADVDKIRAALDAVGVRIYADILTPSGGRHFYVPGHPDLPTVHAAEGRDGLVGYPGVEILSHGTNVFLPGTARTKYAGGGYGILTDQLEALADTVAGDPDSADALVGWVAEHRTAQPETFTPTEAWDGTPPGPRETAYLQAAVRRQAEHIAAMAPESGRNTACFNAGLMIGNYDAGAGLEVDPAIDQILTAAQKCGLVAEDGERAVRASINSGIRLGRNRPRAVPPVDELQLAGQKPPLAVVPEPTLSTPQSEDHGDDPTARVLAYQVDQETLRLRVRQLARDRLAAETAGELVLPEMTRLDRFLAQPDAPVVYRIDQLWPAGGRVVLSAPHKAGKTTTVGNTIRALADATRFLNRFDVAPADRIVLVDNELDENMLRRWLRDQGIRNTYRIDLIALRGRLSTFDLMDPTVRQRWAEHIGPADVLVFDCLRPALDALGLSEDKDAGRFLEALDEFTKECGINDTLVIHHMGHNGERSRGDSRILDWPDALWKLVKDVEDDDIDDGPEPVARRVYFTAYGRDVDQGEVLLHFDSLTRRLSITGGSRDDTRTDRLLHEILTYLEDNPRSSQTAIVAGVGRRKLDVRKTIRHGVDAGSIMVEKAGQTHLHSLTGSAGSRPGPGSPDPVSKAGSPGSPLGNPDPVAYKDPDDDEQVPDHGTAEPLDQAEHFDCNRCGKRTLSKILDLYDGICWSCHSIEAGI